MAAGLTIEKARLGELREFLAEALAAAVGTARQENGLPVDAAVTARGASAEMIELVDRVGPFGAGHPEPVFAFPAHRVAYVEEIGNGNGHIRLSLATEDGATLKAMAFRCAGTPFGQALLAARGRPLHFAGTLSIDHWQSRRQPCLRVIDAAEPVITG